MPATKWGIYHNLAESKYTVSNGEIVFYFSSEFYLNKFLEEYEDHRNLFLDKMKKIVVDNTYNLEILADINLYKKIEKRGFFARLKGVKLTWGELHQYALRKMTEKNTPDWSKMQKRKRETLKRIMT